MSLHLGIYSHPHWCLAGGESRLRHSQPPTTHHDFLGIRYRFPPPCSIYDPIENAWALPTPQRGRNFLECDASYSQSLPELTHPFSTTYACLPPSRLQDKGLPFESSQHPGGEGPTTPRDHMPTLILALLTQSGLLPLSQC